MQEEKIINVSDYSLTSYYVDIFFNEQKLSNATCFFTKYNDKLYLITNWHVVTGKDADTLKLLDTTYASIPNKLKIYLPEEINGSIYFNDKIMEVDLYDSNDNPVWYELKKNNKIIDVVAIPIDFEIDGFYKTIEDAEESYNERAQFEIASEIYIIGYPFGKIGGVLPIWKKASVASEPEIDIDDLPYFFADTASRQGMSGSPVIYYEPRAVTIMSEKENKISRHWTKFIGIYSGRIGAKNNKDNDAQLGRIWRCDVIKAIIDTCEKDA